MVEKVMDSGKSQHNLTMRHMAAVLTACFVFTAMPIDKSFALQLPLASSKEIQEGISDAQRNPIDTATFMEFAMEESAVGLSGTYSAEYAVSCIIKATSPDRLTEKDIEDLKRNMPDIEMRAFVDTGMLGIPKYEQVFFMEDCVPSAGVVRSDGGRAKKLYIYVSIKFGMEYLSPGHKGYDDIKAEIIYTEYAKNVINQDRPEQERNRYADEMAKKYFGKSDLGGLTRLQHIWAEAQDEVAPQKKTYIAENIDDIKRGLPLYHLTTVGLYESNVSREGLRPREELGTDSHFAAEKTSRPDYVYLGNSLPAIVPKAGATSYGATQNKDHLAVLLDVKVPDPSNLEFDEDWKSFFARYLSAWIECLSGEPMTIALTDLQGTTDLSSLKKRIRDTYCLSSVEMARLSYIITEAFKKNNGDFFEIYKAIINDLNLSLKFGKSIAYKGSIPADYIAKVRYVVKDEMRYLSNSRRLDGGKFEDYLEKLYTPGYDFNKAGLVSELHWEKIKILREKGKIDRKLFNDIKDIRGSESVLALSGESDLLVGVLELARRFSESDIENKFSLNLAKLTGILARLKGPSEVDQLFSRLLRNYDMVAYDFLYIKDTDFQWDDSSVLEFYKLSKTLSDTATAKSLLSSITAADRPHAVLSAGAVSQEPPPVAISAIPEGSVKVTKGGKEGKLNSGRAKIENIADLSVLKFLAGLYDSCSGMSSQPRNLNDMIMDKVLYEIYAERFGLPKTIREFIEFVDTEVGIDTIREIIAKKQDELESEGIKIVHEILDELCEFYGLEGKRMLEYKVENGPDKNEISIYFKLGPLWSLFHRGTKDSLPVRIRINISADNLEIAFCYIFHDGSERKRLVSMPHGGIIFPGNIDELTGSDLEDLKDKIRHTLKGAFREVHYLYKIPVLRSIKVDMLYKFIQEMSEINPDEFTMRIDDIISEESPLAQRAFWLGRGYSQEDADLMAEFFVESLRRFLPFCVMEFMHGWDGWKRGFSAWYASNIHIPRIFLAGLNDYFAKLGNETTVLKDIEETRERDGCSSFPFGYLFEDHGIPEDVCIDKFYKTEIAVNNFFYGKFLPEFIDFLEINKDKEISISGLLEGLPAKIEKFLDELKDIGLIRREGDYFIHDGEKYPIAYFVNMLINNIQMSKDQASSHGYKFFDNMSVLKFMLARVQNGIFAGESEEDMLDQLFRTFAGGGSFGRDGKAPRNEAFEILGIDEDEANLEIAKKAFREKVLGLNPDARRSEITKQAKEMGLEGEAAKKYITAQMEPIDKELAGVLDAYKAVRDWLASRSGSKTTSPVEEEWPAKKEQYPMAGDASVSELKEVFMSNVQEMAKFIGDKEFADILDEEIPERIKILAMEITTLFATHPDLSKTITDSPEGNMATKALFYSVRIIRSGKSDKIEPQPLPTTAQSASARMP